MAHVVVVSAMAGLQSLRSLRPSELGLRSQFDGKAERMGNICEGL